MGIVFFCQNCGARFVVDARLAGKKGRCKPCGQSVRIPRADELVSMTGADTTVRRPTSGATLALASSAAFTGVPPITAWRNDSAYLASVLFLVMFLVGTAVKNQPMAYFGAAFVILANLARLVAGVSELAAVLRGDGLDRKNLEKPARRVGEPALVILLVILALTYIPWLRGTRATTTIPDLRGGETGVLERESTDAASGFVDGSTIRVPSEKKP
jgi:hypothetical protein